MKSACFILTCLSAAGWGADVQRARLPLYFEPNVGQTSSEVRFLSRTRGSAVYITDTQAVLELGQSADSRRIDFHMRLIGGAPHPTATGRDRLNGVSNYFRGRDATKWRTNVPHYARVELKDVYPGIDLAYYGNGGQLEYDFVVNPGADPSRIELAFSGARHMRLADGGDLLLDTPAGELRWKTPVAYQSVGGERQIVPVRYEIRGGQRVAFTLARYDDTRPVIVDPVLVFATYLGGSGQDLPAGIAVDSSSNIFVTGSTNSLDFPTASPEQGTGHGADIFVSKLDPAGSSLIYSTYIGGTVLFTSSGAAGIAVGPDGSAYVAGWTTSGDFPVSNALQATFGGSQDAVLLKLDPTGTRLAYSTFVGGAGADAARAIALDSAGNVYLTGTTTGSFPTRNPYQQALGGDWDCFAAKVSAAATLTYSTYLGGSNLDVCSSIAVDASGAAYIAGNTNSTNLPIVNGFQNAFGGGATDAFLVKLNAAGTAIAYSTYLGADGSDDARAVTVDSSGNAYLAGSADVRFPLKDALQPFGFQSGFVAKIDTVGGALVWSTYLGSRPSTATGIAHDAAGIIYVAGQSDGKYYPIAAGIPQIPSELRMPYSALSKLSPDGSILLYSTFLGAGENIVNPVYVAVDNAANAYVTGPADHSGFATGGAFQTAVRGTDAFVAKIRDDGACSFTVSPTDFSFGITGGSGVINVSAPPGCAWNVIRQVEVHLGADVDGVDDHGVGDGSISFSVDYTSSGPQRKLGLVVAGRKVTVNQDGLTCSYSAFSPTSHFPYYGGNANVFVTTNFDCPWTATSQASWIRLLTPASDSGPESAVFAINRNTGPARSGTVTVAGQVITINQDAVAYTIQGDVTVNGTGLAGVTLTLTGSQSLTAVSDLGGHYIFNPVPGGNYTLSASLSGHSFNPASVTLNNLSSDQSINFTEDTLAQITSPAPGSQLGGFSVTFTWTTVPGATAYWLDVGTAPGQGNIFGGNLGLATSKQVTGLPLDFSVVYVSIYANVGGAWRGNAYTYRAAVGQDPKAVMLSPTPGSPLTGSSVTFTWGAGTGVTAYWLDVGTSAGQGNIFGGNVGSAISRTVSGLPTDGRTIYVSLYSNINGLWFGNSYTYIAAQSAKASMSSPIPGTVLQGFSATFSWTTGPGATAYWLDVGTAAGQGNIFGGNVGTSTSKLVTGLPVNGSTVYVSLYSNINGAWLANSYTYTAATAVDPKAAIVSPPPGSTLGGATMTFSWTGGSGVSAYWLDVGTAPGQGNIFGGNVGTSTSRVVNNLPVNGATIYVSLYSNINGIWFGNSYTYAAAQDARAAITTPAPGSILSGFSATFNWTTGTGVAMYWLDVGTAPGVGNIFGGNVGTATSQVVDGLPTDGTTVYVSLYSNINGNWQGNSYTFTTATVANPKAAILSPAPGSVLGGASVNFTWSAGSGVTMYWLDVGTAPGQGNIFGGNVGMATSRLVNGLPGNGSTVYVNLYSSINGKWYGNSYTYLAATDGRAAITSPAPGSTLAGFSATFSWSVGAGATAYWLDVGTAPLQGNIFGGNVGTSTSKLVYGLPTNGSTVYVSLYSQIGGTWQVNSSTYRAATTQDPKAAILTPAPGTTLTGTSATFTWSPGAGVSMYWLDVGTAPGQGNIFGGDVGQITSKLVTGLPTSGTVYVNLYSNIGGTWFGNSYLYTAGP